MAPLRLATGDLWDAEHNRPTGTGCSSQDEPPDRRRLRACVERFRAGDRMMAWKRDGRGGG